MITFDNISTMLPRFLRLPLARIKNFSLGYRIARGAFWSVLGTLFSRGFALASFIVVARILGREIFGELGIIQSTVSMFGVFAGFGLGLTANKHVAEFRDKDPSKAGRIMALSSTVSFITGGVMALILVIISPWLAKNILAAPHLGGLLKISAIVLFFEAVNGAQTGALAGFEAFKSIAKVNFIVGIATFPIMVGGVFIAGLEGTVWALVVTRGLNWLLNHLMLRREASRKNINIILTGCTRELPVLWKFSFPAFLSMALFGPVNWICHAMLVNQPNGYGEMGIFNAANRWYSALLFFPNTASMAVLPILSERLGIRDKSGASRILSYTMRGSLIYALPIVLILSIFSPQIMSLYGNDFASSWPILIVVLFTAGLISVQAPVGKIIAASGRMWIGMTMNLGWALCYIAGTYLLVGKGAIGLASARAIAYIIHSVWVFTFVFWLKKNSY